MYIIQIDRQSWFRGFWLGWLVSCNSPREALVYPALSEANREVNYCREVAPDFNFSVQPLHDV